MRPVTKRWHWRWLHTWLHLVTQCQSHGFVLSHHIGLQSLAPERGMLHNRNSVELEVKTAAIQTLWVPHTCQSTGKQKRGGQGVAMVFYLGLLTRISEKKMHYYYTIELKNICGIYKNPFSWISVPGCPMGENQWETTACLHPLETKIWVTLVN